MVSARVVSLYLLCTEQTDEQDFKLEGKGDWKDGDWQRVCAVALLQLSIDCELVEPRRRQPGIKGREMAERGAVDGGSHQSLFGVAEQDIEGQVNQQRREASMYVWLTGWLAARLVIGRYQCRLGMTMTMTLQIAVNEWKSDALHVRSSRSEWMGMMVLDSWTGGGCSSCVTYKCDSECHCRSANGGMDKSFLWTVSSSFKFVSGCSIRVCLSVIRFRVIDERSLMDAIPTNWTETRRGDKCSRTRTHVERFATFSFTNSISPPSGWVSEWVTCRRRCQVFVLSNLHCSFG